jgi:hypothetical protein
MTVLALEGSFASVIGGAPAAAVVFAGEVEKRTSADPRVREVESRLAEASESDWSRRGPVVTAGGEVTGSRDGAWGASRPAGW